MGQILGKHRPEVHLRAERTKPFGLRPSPEGALFSERGDSFPRELEKLALLSFVDLPTS